MGFMTAAAIALGKRPVHNPVLTRQILVAGKATVHTLTFQEPSTVRGVGGVASKTFSPLDRLVHKSLCQVLFQGGMTIKTQF